AAADFAAVIGPCPASPVTEIAHLRAKQMKKRVAIARLAGRNARFDHLLVKVRAGFFHWSEQVFIAPYPGNVVRPTAAFHMEPIVLLFQLGDYFGQLLRPITGLKTIPDPFLEQRLYCRKILVTNAGS